MAVELPAHPGDSIERIELCPQGKVFTPFLTLSASFKDGGSKAAVFPL